MASVVSVSPGQTGAFDPSGLPVATVTGAWTLVPSEFSAFMVDATGAPFTATLPKAASWVGAPIVIKAITATANLVTLRTRRPTSTGQRWSRSARQIGRNVPWRVAYVGRGAVARDRCAWPVGSTSATFVVSVSSGTPSSGQIPQFTGTGNAVTAIAAPIAVIDTTATDIQMNGVLAAGSVGKAADAGHVHPTDTSCAPVASPALTGTPTAPTQAALDNSTKLATTAYADTAVGVEATRALAAEALLIPASQKGAASGVATLDATTKIPAGQLPASVVTAGQTPAALGAQLLTNGTVASNATGWTLAGGASWAGGVVTLAPSGASMSQSISVTSGATYLVTFLGSHTTGSDYAVSIGGVSVQAGYLGSGSFNMAAVVVAGGSTGSQTFSVAAATSTSVNVSMLTVQTITALTPTLAGFYADSNQNLALGYAADQLISAGSLYNTAIGYRALASNAGSYNTAIGVNALKTNSTGEQ